ncbi:hypothetical protein Esti_001720 [Eimeria stiedai]
MSTSEEPHPQAGNAAGGPPRGRQQVASEQPWRGAPGEEQSQLHGEGLVMCLRGLANVDHHISREERLVFVELLTPYLLSEQPSLLGSPPSSRRLPLLFGSLSALTRLGAGTPEVSRLMEAACKQPPETLGPYEACDLLAAALALQPAAAAAAAAAAPEALSSGAEPHVGSSPPALVSAVGVGGRLKASFLIGERRRASPSPSFQSALHCYACAVRLGLEALQVSLFRMHPTFRVSVLSTLTSLDAVLPHAARPHRHLFDPTAASPNHNTQQQQQQEATHTGRLLGGSISLNVCAAAAAAGASAGAAAAAGCEGHAAGRSRLQEKEEICLPRSSTLNVVSFASRANGAGSSCMQPPLHPLVRRVLLAVFYRLPCVPLRLLVELLEALHACWYIRREEKGEQLCPHGKSARWHRPLLAALAREGVRRMHDAREGLVLRFVLLFYGELDGLQVSLDPLVFACNRLSRAPFHEALQQQPEVLAAFRAILVKANMKPEAASALKRLTPGGARLVEGLLHADSPTADSFSLI